MKKTSNIQIDWFRKSGTTFQMKSLSLAVAALTFAACSPQKQEVKVVGSVEECRLKTELTLEECEAAYKKALEEAERTAPRYSDRRMCEADFGPDQCRQNSSGVFLPLMTGFMLGNILSSGRETVHHHHNPVFEYRNAYSNNRDKVITADGRVIGAPGRDSYSVPKAATKPKPTVTKTLQRSGFGSKASAKASWGSGKSSGGWGG
jgi:uncharacterized protein YgiB involved in biofilm formation